MKPTSQSIDQLLEHADWVRSLARSLVRDAARADDVAQEVWLAALRRGPPDERNVRGWLRTVARRIAGATGQRERQTGERERTAARSESLPSTVEMAASASSLREVSRLVLALDEPYRRIVLLRYWEGLAPREIAAREAIPIATVKTRLQRAQARLKERLEKDHGKDWCLVLAPALGRIPAGPDGKSTLLRPRHLWPAAALTGIVAVVAGARLLGDGHADESLESPAIVIRAPRPGALEGEANAETLSATSTPQSARVLAGGARSEVGAAVANRPGPRLVDTNGEPLEGLRLRLPGAHAVRWQGGDPVWIGNNETTLRLSLEEQEDLRADRAALVALCEAQLHPREWSAALLGTPIEEREFSSGPNGHLDHPRAEDAEVVEPGWTSVGVVQEPGSGSSHVAAPAVELAGVVLDSRGSPVADAEVMVTIPVRAGLDPATGPPPCRTDDQGRFVLRCAPSFDGVVWQVRSDEHTPWSEPIPRRDHRSLVAQLEPLSAATKRIAGLVLGADGQPVPRARVHFGDLRVAVDEDGAFTLLVPEPEHGEQTRLLAWAPGHAPLFDERAAADLAASGDGYLWRTLVLDGQTFDLSGQVVDAAGRALPGISVGLAEPAILDGTLSSIEARVDERAAYVSTDADGRFRLGGLLAPLARLRLFDPESGRTVVTAAVTSAKGTIEVPFPTPRLANVHGRVVWPSTQRPERTTVRVGFDWLRTPSGEGALFEAAPRVEVARDGTFELEGVPAANVWLEVECDGATQRYAIEELDVTRALELVLHE